MHFVLSIVGLYWIYTSVGIVSFLNAALAAGIVVLLGYVMVAAFVMLRAYFPRDVKALTTLELIERMRYIGRFAQLEPPGAWWNQQDRCFWKWLLERIEPRFQVFQVELGRRDLHPDGKASVGHGDSVFQLLEIMSMNANCDKAKLEECVDQYLALRNGEKYDLQSHGGIVTGPRRANQNKAKRAGLQRGKK